MFKKPFKLFFLIILSLLLISCQSTDQPTIKTNNTEHSVIIQFKNSCDFSDLIPGEIKLEIELNDYTLIGTTASIQTIKSFKKEECIERSFRPTELDTVLSELKSDFNKDREQKFKEKKMKRGLENKDVTGKDEVRQFLEDKHPEKDWPSGTISPYQLYVTPDSQAVQELANKLDGLQEIYDESLSWIWVSETYLNGVEEMWYYPQEFLTKTKLLPNNPSKGDIASDCSEQANTLASLLIADGYSTQDVRVVLGLVDFEGILGGHAWVEIYDDNSWFALEATAGAYYDEVTNTLTEAEYLPYNYFQYTEFPVEEVWYYYNNDYFWDNDQSSGNAPDSWKQQSRDQLKERLKNFQNRKGPLPK